MDKLANDIEKLAKAVVSSKKVPMTDDEKDWYDKLELHLERLEVDGNRMSDIDVRKWDGLLMLEASYGSYEKSWIVIEVSNDKTMVDYTPAGENNPTKKLRVKGSNIDRPQVAIRMIDKVAQ